MKNFNTLNKDKNINKNNYEINKMEGKKIEEKSSLNSIQEKLLLNQNETSSNSIEDKTSSSFKDKYQYIADLVSIKSFSLSENKEIIDYLIAQFSPYAEEILKIKNDFDDRVNLLIGLNTKLENGMSPIILSGHIDTVTADEKAYRTCPYRPHCVWQ